MVVTRVAPLSAAKIAGILYAIMGLVFGAILSLASIAGGFAADASEGALFGALFGIGAVVILPIFYGCIGFVATAIMAALYNVLAGAVGGVEIDVA